MEVIKEVAEFFLVSVGFGVFIFTSLTDPKLTGGGLMKLMLSVCLGSFLLATSLHLIESSLVDLTSLSLFASFTILAFAYGYFLKRDSHNWFSKALYFPFVFLAISYCSFQMSFETEKVMFLLLSVLFIGVVVYLMILGHWYLVTPKLTTRPLKIGLKFTWLFLIFKLAFSSYGVSQNLGFFQPATLLGDGYSFNVMTLFSRFLIGYLGILVVSIFGWKLTKMGDTQGATGIFYVMVIFLFIGELFSGYLFFEYGLLI